MIFASLTAVSRLLSPPHQEESAWLSDLDLPELSSKEGELCRSILEKVAVRTSKPGAIVPYAYEVDFFRLGRSTLY